MCLPLGYLCSLWQYGCPLDSFTQLALAVPQSLSREFSWGSAGPTSQSLTRM